MSKQNEQRVDMFRGHGPGRGPLRMFQGQKPEVKDKKSTIKRLWGYLGIYKFSLLIVFLLVLMAGAREMLTPWFISIAIDKYIIPGKFNGLFFLIIAMAGVFLAAAGAGWLQQYLMITISQKSLRNLRNDLFSHIQTLDLKYYDKHTHGELMSRFTNDIENISNVVAQVITQFLTGIISITGVLIMMYLMNLWLAIITSCTVPFIFVITRLIGKRTGESFREQQKLLGQINGQIEETVTGMKVVRLFHKEEETAGTLNKTNQHLKKVAIRALVFAGAMGPVMNLLNNLRYAIIAAAGGVLGVQGLVSIGTIAAFLNYTRQFGRPVAEMAQLYNSILSALAGAERVFEVIDRKPEVTTTPGSKVVTDIKGKVVFNNVHFSYTGGVPVLKNVHLAAHPGQTIALVGPTGAGKTTIVNLLTRFYDIQDGEILIDDVNIRDYRLESLRQSLGLVLQDTFLFLGTVVENIRYGNLSASDDEVIEAAKASRADHFIRHLPDGYMTILSEDGQNLSQGQRQLVTIARAILANPSILILDEATSNVDTRTEKLIQDGMLHLMQGRTSFVIAHRLSTIRNADMILVLKDGEIIERGNHRELLAQKGFYAQLHANHFETEL
ncbi:MAG: ABC transporter ATP-binding protein [Spirochaetales bacterium]|nr:ABC transporter ATP-binding protein [Spirochaetales bacterium]